MTEPDPLVSALHRSRQRFLELVADVRPELHRYCARMTGSVADGEDIVQETLARAYYALAEVETVPPLRPWLFQIAHNRAIDHLRRLDKTMPRPLDEVASDIADERADPEDTLGRKDATHFALSCFSELPPLQRSAVILKDVLDHSLEEIAALLGLTLPAAKSAIHRGRDRLRALAATTPRGDSAPKRSTSPETARYIALFNARDWDGVRAMLAEDVRLDLVSRAQRSGRRDVSAYFTNYDKVTDWHLVPASLDDREVIAVFRNANDARPSYFVELTWADGRLRCIKDFRYVPYIAEDAEIIIEPRAVAGT